MLVLVVVVVAVVVAVAVAVGGVVVVVVGEVCNHANLFWLCKIGRLEKMYLSDV